MEPEFLSCWVCANKLVDSSLKCSSPIVCGAPQPGGLPDSSRWLKRSENHRNRLEKGLHSEGVRESQENLWRTLLIWHPVGVRSFLHASTGGLRFATTTGYFLATPGLHRCTQLNPQSLPDFRIRRIIRCPSL